VTVVPTSDAVLDALPRPRTGPPGRGGPADEEQSIARVVELLLAAFPAVPEPAVRECVARLLERFADAPVRQYIPILVARRARAALAALPAPAGVPG
jgi:hypothetical protein